MNKVKWMLLAAFLPLALWANAKSGGEINGRVLNADQSPAAYASVALLKTADSTLALGAITGEDGRFSIMAVTFGNYFVKVSMIGMANTFYGPFEVAESQSSFALPDLLLKPASQELAEITVSATQPLYIHKPDMLIVNVEGSAIKSNGSVFELLKKTPGVIIDQNGNITLKGKSGVNITIDGKSSYLSGDQLNALLQNMSADDVSRIEVISNPSARYDAQGTSGIINIVTKRSRKKGINGSASAGAGYGRSAKSKAGLVLNYGSEKWGGQFSYGFSNYAYSQAPHLFRRINYMGTTTEFDQATDIRNKPYTNNLRAGIDFFPSASVSTGFQLSGTMTDAISTTVNTTNIGIPQQDTATVLQQLNIEQSRFTNPGVGAYYKKTFDTLGRELSVNADYLRYRTDGHTNYGLHYSDALGATIAPPEWQRSNNGSALDIAVAKADYVHPTKKGTRFEAGVKSSYVTTANNLFFEELRGETWTNDTLRTNDFSYKELIHAAYTNASGKWKKWTLQAGLRAEMTDAEGYSATLDRRTTTKYLQLFPSAFILRPINEKHTLNLSYSRRINRPDYESLNPFVFYLDKYTFKKGNPFLRPEFSNAVELTHSYNDKIYTTLAYSRTHDAMTEVVLQIDSTSTSYQTTENLNTTDNASVSTMFPLALTKWWATENNIIGFYTRIKSPLAGNTLKNETYAVNISTTNTFNLPKGWKAELTGWYQTKMLYSVFELSPCWGINTGLTGSFFKNKLSATVSAEDLFHTSSPTVTIHYEGQDAFIIQGHESRKVWLTLRYKFGKSFEKRASGYSGAAEELKNRAGGK